MSDFIKVAKAITPTKYLGLVPKLGAKKFFEKHPGMYVVWDESKPAPKAEPAKTVEPTEAVKPSSIKRSSSYSKD